MENMDTSYDVFFSAFEGEDGNQTDTAEDAKETETTEETTEETQDESDSAETAGEVTEESAEEDGAEGGDKGDDGGSEQKFTIKVNKQDMELTLPQMTEYAQKGADYDRVKGQLETSRQNEQTLQAKLDEQQEAMDILNMISEQTGTPMAELLEQLHINAVKKEGQTDAEVKAQIRADKLERQLKAKNEQQTQQKAAEDEAATRMQREVADFRKQFMVDFDFSVLKTLQLGIKQDVGASSYWSEMASMQTLDNLLINKLITPAQYIERLPNGYITKKEELLAELRAASAAPTPAPDTGTGMSTETTSSDMPVQGGSGNGALQRALNREGA